MDRKAFFREVQCEETRNKQDDCLLEHQADANLSTQHRSFPFRFFSTSHFRSEVRSSVLSSPRRCLSPFF